MTLAGSVFHENIQTLKILILILSHLVMCNKLGYKIHQNGYFSVTDNRLTKSVNKFNFS